MKALIVDDDLVLADVVSFTLRRAGFEVMLAHDGKTALDRFQKESPGIVILDLELPQISGLEVCRAIRTQSNTPIIMLTVRDTDEDVVKGLELGADDYITKPFSPAQLVARAQAVLRRGGSVQVPRSLSFGELRLIPDRHAVELTNQLEYKLIETFVLNKEQVLAANTLIDHVWGPGGGDKAMLKQLVYRLRRKIEGDDSTFEIEAIPGIGYALVRKQSR
jgi:DNA-binding response OmpR family regulator